MALGRRPAAVSGRVPSPALERPAAGAAGTTARRHAARGASRDGQLLRDLQVLHVRFALGQFEVNRYRRELLKERAGQQLVRID